MLQMLYERRGATLLTALFLVCFTLMSLSARRRGGTTVFEELALSISGVLIETATAPRRWTQNIWDNYIALRGVREENKRMLKELASLRSDSVRIVLTYGSSGPLIMASVDSASSSVHASRS